MSDKSSAPAKADRAERFHPDPSVGLSASQVQSRMRQGLHNGDGGAKTKTEGQIIRENVFTFFNLLNFILGAAVILVGSPRNALFLGVILSNIVIGSFQGIRAKHTIDKLSVISAPKATVLRDGARSTIAVKDVVLDDILLLSSGGQICADCMVMEGECEVNESLITGESDPVPKGVGEALLSGSFVVSGSCAAQVERVGADSYANQIAGNAKVLKKRNSQILGSIDLLVKVIGFAIIPIGALLFWKQYFALGSTLQESVVSTTAAIVGMIPEGLVLLISLAFAVSVVKLSAHKTLVQDMYCVETLARVDVLCLDKTGTITEGSMQVDEFLPFPDFTEEEMTQALTALVNALPDDNPTFLALKDRLPGESAWQATKIVPFSSARKWSGAAFGEQGSYVMGAGDFILGQDFEAIRAQVEQYSSRGQRVLLLVQSQDPFDGKELPQVLIPMGLVLISDKIRREAPRTLRYFADQGVTLKVISGDNPVTVANIARKAGLEHADDYIDASELRTEEDIRAAVERYTVFGRVTPDQKLAFVKALKAAGHTVAMTGDGVNDVLALREADCSVAMASGSDAARTVSNLVLLDSNFASMPLVVQEGRRSINNLQRSASLFLVKTIFSALIGVFFIFLNYSYPFQPIQQTLISSLTIGIPSFLLALEPNRERVRGSFLFNVLKLSVPAALTMTLNVLLLCSLGGSLGLTGEEISTGAVLLTSATGFLMLIRVCMPFNVLRGSLVTALAAVFLCATLFARPVFFLVEMSAPLLTALLPLLLLAVTLMLVFLHLVDRVFPAVRRSRERKRRASRRRVRSREA